MSLMRMIPPATRKAAKRWLGFEMNYQPQVCIERQMLGSNDGVWCVSPRTLRRDAIVYSFGIGTDISFDLALIEQHGVTVHAFDPTPKSLDWLATQDVPSEMNVIPCGLADYDGKARFNPPVDSNHVSHTMLSRPATEAAAIEVEVRRLETIMHDLQHDQIDLLKMDIEGAEYDVLDDMMQSDIKPRQLLVEFHHRFPGAGTRPTHAAIRQLKTGGYRLFHISQSQMEFSFIHQSELRG